MILTEKHIIKKSNPFYCEMDKLCFLSKNLYNRANYIVRQEFIKSSGDKQLGLIEHANYFNYYDINKLMINTNDCDYVRLPRKVSNQTLMSLDKNWKSFFATIKDYSRNKSKYRGKPSLPSYKDKNGRYPVIYELGSISKTEIKNNIIKLSKTNIKIKTNVNINTLKQCRIIPKGNHYVVEVVYEKQENKLKENNNRYCSIDLGLNNLACIGSNVIKPIIINGKPLKSINQYYNKKMGKFKSDLNHYTNKRGEKIQLKTSKRINNLTNKRNNKINDYLHKSSRYIINHLVFNNINTIIIGNNREWKQDINIGKRNNQNFVNIPHSRFIEMLLYKAKLEGITVMVNEESYTSKCSFIDNEEICKHEIYCGSRVKRGLFKSKSGGLINADLNGSLNILRKAVPNIGKMIVNNGIEVIAVSPIVSTINW